MIADVKTGLLLALKGIFRKKVIFALIVFIIALGFVNMVFLPSFTNGMTHTINTQMITKHFGNIIIEPREGEKYIDNAEAVLKKIRAVPGVMAATRRYQLGAILQTEDGERTIASWLFQAIEPEEEKRVTDFQDFLLDGAYLSSSDRDEIMIGTHLAGGDTQQFMPREETLEASVGDKVFVTYSNGVKKEYRVKGIIDSRDFNAVMSSYITIKEAEEILGVSGKASMIVVRVPTGQEAAFVRKFAELGISDKIRTWDQKATQGKLIGGMFDAVNKIFVAVGIIIIFFTIYVATSINVINRRKQLGILKALGIKKETIALSYIFMAVLFATFGIVFAGIAIAVITKRLIAHPIDTPMGYIYPVLSKRLFWSAVLVVFVSAILGSIIPSYREIRKNIVKLIWG